MAAKTKSSTKINRAESILCEKKFNLSLEYQIDIRSKYKNYKSLLQLTQDIYEDPKLDENSNEFKNVKNFVTRIHSGQEIHDFTEEQIELIVDKAESTPPMDIARLLFPENGNPRDEGRSVASLTKALGIECKTDKKIEPLLGPYVPITTDHKIIALINRADMDANYHISKLDADKKKKIAFLKKCLNNPRVVAMISAIRSKQHREVFETQFVLYLIDKVDGATPEDVAGFANLANENVRSLLITEEMALLNDRLAEASSDDEESRKFTKNLSDALATKATEYNSCQTRMIKLHDDLTDKRSNRLKYQGILNESLAKYIELAKTEEGRQYMIRLAKIREEQLSEECNRIKSLGDLVGEVRGISIEEILKFQ